MITYTKVKTRHVISMNNNDLADLNELVWLLKHTPPPAGYNRKPFTLGQQRIIDNLYNIIDFGNNYAEHLNARTGQ